ncbi:unnamed protein product [Tenebrio molitor]|nr:unnamed protein product [Tenebrio molitor]
MNQIFAGKGVTTLIIGIFRQRKIQELFFQGLFKSDLWAGLLGNRMVGPFEFPARLTGSIYAEILNMEFPHLLDDIPLVFRVFRGFQI